MMKKMKMKLFCKYSYTSRSFLRRSIFHSASRYAALSQPLEPFCSFSHQQEAYRSTKATEIEDKPNGSEYPPVKAQVFMDGTWLYYSLLVGREDRYDPVQSTLGKDWHEKYSIQWNKLPNIIARGLSDQLKRQGALRQDVEVIRTSVFTSLRNDTPNGSMRDQMLKDYYKANFDVHKFETISTQEKCVDISLAVQMMYMATVPNAYDIAVLVSGDKDFLPALQMARMLGKRVAICSIRTSCNRFLSDPTSNCRDFDLIWIDDNIDQLFVSTSEPGNLGKDELLLLDIVRKMLNNSEGKTMSSRDLGKQLQREIVSPSTNALVLLKSKFASLKTFLELFRGEFVVGPVEKSQDGFLFQVTLRDGSSDESEDAGDDTEEEEEDEEDDAGEASSDLAVFDEALVIDSIKSLIVTLQKSNTGFVSVRHIGRELQNLPHADMNLLSFLKKHRVSLMQFISQRPTLFEYRQVGKRRGECEVRLRGSMWTRSDSTLPADPTVEEMASEDNNTATDEDSVSNRNGELINGGEETFASLSLKSVATLKEMLRQRGLVTQGTKKVLVSRLVDHLACVHDPEASRVA